MISDPSDFDEAAREVRELLRGLVPVEESVSLVSGGRVRKGVRRDRETYNAYMREYMRKRRRG